MQPFSFLYFGSLYLLHIGKHPTVSLTPFEKGIYIVVIKEPMKINYKQN